MKENIDNNTIINTNINKIKKSKTKKLNDDNVIEPFFIFNKHKGPIRALQWSPWHNNILASGGGKKITVLNLLMLILNQLLVSITLGVQCVNFCGINTKKKLYLLKEIIKIKFVFGLIRK